MYNSDEKETSKTQMQALISSVHGRGRPSTANTFGSFQQWDTFRGVRTDKLCVLHNLGSNLKDWKAEDPVTFLLNSPVFLNLKFLRYKMDFMEFCKSLA